LVGGVIFIRYFFLEILKDMTEPAFDAVAQVADIFPGRLFPVLLFEHRKVVEDGIDIMPFVFHRRVVDPLVNSPVFPAGSL